MRKKKSPHVNSKKSINYKTLSGLELLFVIIPATIILGILAGMSCWPWNTLDWERLEAISAIIFFGPLLILNLIFSLRSFIFLQRNDLRGIRAAQIAKLFFILVLSGLIFSGKILGGQLFRFNLWFSSESFEPNFWLDLVTSLMSFVFIGMLISIGYMFFQNFHQKNNQL